MGGQGEVTVETLGEDVAGLPVARRSIRGQRCPSRWAWRRRHMATSGRSGPPDWRVRTGHIGQAVQSSGWAHANTFSLGRQVNQVSNLWSGWLALSQSGLIPLG